MKVELVETPLFIIVGKLLDVIHGFIVLIKLEVKVKLLLVSKVKYVEFKFSDAVLVLVL